jgi:hypothetical protein
VHGGDSLSLADHAQDRLLFADARAPCFGCPGHGPAKPGRIDLGSFRVESGTDDALSKSRLTAAKLGRGQQFHGLAAIQIVGIRPMFFCLADIGPDI